MPEVPHLLKIEMSGTPAPFSIGVSAPTLSSLISGREYGVNQSCLYVKFKGIDQERGTCAILIRMEFMLSRSAR